MKKTILILLALLIVSAPLMAKANTDIRPIAAITVEPVIQKKWVENGTRFYAGLPVGVQYRGESGKLSSEIAIKDQLGPKAGVFLEFADEKTGGVYGGARFEMGASFYPLFPKTWKNCGLSLMTDLSLNMRILLHSRLTVFDGRMDLYAGAGFEFSFFNPRSDQKEVQLAFGHEMGKLGNFDLGGGLNAIGGISFDIAGKGKSKWTVFLEGELRTLMPLHVYLTAQTGVKYGFPV